MNDQIGISPAKRGENESRKVWSLNTTVEELLPWIDAYITLVVIPFREEAGIKQLLHHLLTFTAFCEEVYGVEKITIVRDEDLLNWEVALRRDQKESTVSAYLQSVRRFLVWVKGVAPHLVKIHHAPSLPRESTTPYLTSRQLMALKETARIRVVERSFASPQRPMRDRAIVLLLLELGVGREELTELTIGAVVTPPLTPSDLYAFAEDNEAVIRIGERIRRGLSLELRHALVDYILTERAGDGGTAHLSEPLFLSASNRTTRAASGKLSPRAINLLLTTLLEEHNKREIEEEDKLTSLTPRILRRTYDEWYSR